MTEHGSQRPGRKYRYYGILGVARDASPAQIRQAYLSLAKTLHPDINPNAEAHERFKKINQAYEVLSDPIQRASYDGSTAECPVCWTHEVIETIETRWRCRHCGCAFDPSQASEIIEQVEKVAIPEWLRKAVRLFETTQCSWCKKFYTQPFLCPYKLLQSNCWLFDRLDDSQRTQFVAQERWWWRMEDELQQVRRKGLMCRCRKCGALNPNPKKRTCWRCEEDGLTCPKDGALLAYDSNTNVWKCTLAAHGGTYAFRPKAASGPTDRSQGERSRNVNLLMCPRDHTKSIWYNDRAEIYECKNEGCPVRGKKLSDVYGGSTNQQSRRQERATLLIGVSLVMLLVIAGLVVLATRWQPQPPAIPLKAAGSTPTPTATVSAPFTAPAPTLAPSPTPLRPVTPTSAPTLIVAPILAPTPVRPPTATPTQAPTVTPARVPTPTSSPTATLRPPTPTPTPAPTATQTRVPTPTASPTPTPVPPWLRYDFNDGSIPRDFQPSGQPWRIETNAGENRDGFSIRSGVFAVIGVFSETRLVVNPPSGSRTVSFYVKVSSASGQDKLEFRLENAVVRQWSGEVPWTRTPEFDLPGTSPLLVAWRYSKNAPTPSGKDAAWIDTIEFR